MPPSHSERHFRAMLKEAKDRVLYVSPPYSRPSEETAFLSGYETALRDIASGQLRPHHPDVDIYGRHLREAAGG